MNKKLNANPRYLWYIATLSAIWTFLLLIDENTSIWQRLLWLLIWSTITIILIKIKTYLTEKYFIVFNKNTIEFAQKINWYLWKSENLVINKNEILVIELRKTFWFLDTPWFFKKQFSQQRTIIIHQKNWQQYKLWIPFDWTNESVWDLNKERLKMVIYTNTNWKEEKKQSITQ